MKLSSTRGSHGSNVLFRFLEDLLPPGLGMLSTALTGGGSQCSMTDQDVGIKTEPFQINVGQLQLGNSVWRS